VVGSVQAIIQMVPGSITTVATSLRLYIIYRLKESEIVIFLNIKPNIPVIQV